MGEARGRRILGVIRRSAIIVIGNVVVAAVLLMLLEGAASMLFTAREIARTPAVPEHEHAEHDTLLGWVNLQNVNIPDMYGPGAGVRTNGQRFRNDRDFPAAVSAGTIRIICSGDSFTFGYGVGNDDVWCERLTRLDHRLETVNMGLGGFGVDQAYLWYKRDGTRIDHDIHLFAFLTADFNRMKSDRFMGYGKPFLEVDGDSIVVVNQPVPRTSWLARRRALHGETIANLNLVRLARGVFGGEPDPEVRMRRDAAEDARQRRVVTHIFADLLRINQSRGSRLVLVYFPGMWDYQNVAASETWQQFVADEAARQGIAFIDMIEELRRVPPADVDGLFAPNLHFSVTGNAWAADVLHRRLAPIIEEAATAAERGG